MRTPLFPTTCAVLEGDEDDRQWENCEQESVDRNNEGSVMKSCIALARHTKKSFCSPRLQQRLLNQAGRKLTVPAVQIIYSNYFCGLLVSHFTKMRSALSELLHKPAAKPSLQLHPAVALGLLLCGRLSGGNLTAGEE